MVPCDHFSLQGPAQAIAYGPGFNKIHINSVDLLVRNKGLITQKTLIRRAFGVGLGSVVDDRPDQGQVPGMN